MRLVFEIPDDLHARFKAQTAVLGVKQAAVVRDLVLSWLETHESTPESPGSVTNVSGSVTNVPGASISRDEVLRRLRTKK